MSENLGTWQVPNCHRTPIPKFHFEMLLFNLAQGLTGPQKNLAVTLKGAKNVKECFWSLPQGGNVFFHFLPFWGPKIKYLKRLSNFPFDKRSLK